MKTITFAALAAFALIIPGGIVHAQSFDCDRARRSDEIRICESRRLSALDNRLNRAYRRAMRNTNHPSRLAREQRAWLAERRACGSSWPCIRDAIEGRIAELNRE